jgi:hypothetical protein
MKWRVQIIECTAADDPGSEGRGLKHVFDLMEVESNLLRVKSIDQMLGAIADSKYKVAHIATHGSVNRTTDKFKGWWTPKGVGGRSKVAEFDDRFKQSAIVSTACRSGSLRLENMS